MQVCHNKTNLKATYYFRFKAIVHKNKYIIYETSNLLRNE